MRELVIGDIHGHGKTVEILLVWCAQLKMIALQDDPQKIEEKLFIFGPFF